MKIIVLSDICEINSGGTPSRSILNYYQGEIPWAKISDIEKAENGVIFDTEEKISVEGLKSIRNKLFPKDTLLFAMYGSIGKVAITGRELSTNQAILGISPKNTDQVNLKYLKIWFERNKQKLINQGRGVALQNLSATIIRNLEIPLPPLDDQIRIANVLGRAEALIAKRKEGIKTLDEFLKSTFLEMFGDPARNEKRWVKIVFESVVRDFRNGQSPVTTGHTEGKVYTLSAITGNSFKGDKYKISTFESIHDNSIVKNDDFLICRGNGNIKLVGRSAIVRDISDNIIFPDTMICANIDITKINKKFIEVMWKLPFIRSQIEQFARTTNGTYKINQQSLKSIMIIVPPIKLQFEFAAIVGKIESLKLRYKQSLSELESLYGSLSQRAFKGELDLSKVLVETDNENKELHINDNAGMKSG
jgi:type I restriction enzyme S subunit